MDLIKDWIYQNMGLVATWVGGFLLMVYRAGRRSAKDESRDAKQAEVNDKVELRLLKLEASENKHDKEIEQLKGSIKMLMIATKEDLEGLTHSMEILNTTITEFNQNLYQNMGKLEMIEKIVFEKKE